MADIVLESPFGPEWLAGNKINELEFCKAFLEQHPMICIHGTFFTPDGRVTDENKLKKEIISFFSSAGRMIEALNGKL